MKLISMHIDNFGCLHDYDYDFDDGLNVVLHDNGWGKTTMAAFLKAMLYGFDTKRSKDITENVRKRYLPWQGGNYGGTLDFEAGDVRYRISRTFGETPRFDKAKIVVLDTGVTAKISPDRIGETLFQLDASAFQRSVFVNQNGLSIAGAASSIHTRLNALVSQANDVAAFDGAVATLTEKIKKYEKTGGRGKIGEIARQITSAEQKREKLEAEIAQQDSARERISQLDKLITDIDNELGKKKQQLDEVSGEARKREAARKLLEELNKQIAELQQQMDAIQNDLGGHIPTPAEIDQVRRQKQSAAAIAQQLSELKQNCEKLEEDLAVLYEKYHHMLPTASELDEIQSIYGKLQGIRSSEMEVTDSAEAEPKGYTLIQAISDSDPDAVSRIQCVVDDQETLQDLIRDCKAAEQKLQSEQASWSDKKKRYTGYAEEVARLQAEIDERKLYAGETVDPVIHGLEELQKKERAAAQCVSEQEAAVRRGKADWADKKHRYASLQEEIDSIQPEAEQRSRFSPEKVDPVIAILEELQKQQQLVDVRTEELSGAALTEAQEALLAANMGDLPDTEEGSALLKKIRSIKQKNSDIQGLEARKAGEQSKVDTLQVSVDQLGTIVDTDGTVAEKPKKSSGVALITAGAVLTVIGVVLLFAVTPVMAVVAAIGVILVVLGVVRNKGYQAYKTHQASASQRQEHQKKKADLQTQLKAAQAVVADLQGQIDDLHHEIQKEQAEIDAWADTWMPGQAVTESAVSAYIEQTEQVAKLRKQKQDTAEKAQFVAEKTAYIDSERQKADTAFPEIARTSIAEALRFLRSAETEYKLYDSRLDTARKALESFFAETELTAEKLRAEELPELAERQTELDRANAELKACAEQRKAYDEIYPEMAGLSQEEALQCLRAKASDYRVIAGQLQKAERDLQKCGDETGLGQAQLPADEAPDLATWKNKYDKLSEELTRTVDAVNAALKPLNLNADVSHIMQAVREAEQLLNEYQQHSDRLKDRAARYARKQQQIDELQQKLDDRLALLQGNYADAAVPERLKLVREDVNSVASLEAKFADAEQDKKRQQEKRKAAENAVEAFQTAFGKFKPETEDILAEIHAKVSRYAELNASVRQLDKQKANADFTQDAAHTTPGAEESVLRDAIAQLEARRDSLRDEYTHKSDFIRQADCSLEQYPDVIQEIHDLYEQKQKAQNTLTMLKRTIQLIRQAKENLANRYLSRVERLFNQYIHIWLNNDTVRGILDMDFNVMMEENDKLHVAQGYSTGYCDMIDLCMRLALVDTLFEKEKPFLIMDDPFVNLDVDRLNIALELLHVMAAEKQIIYFVCHPIRAVETDKASVSRDAFVKLAEAARKTIEERRSVGTERRKVVRKLPKEMYKVVDAGTGVAIRPAQTDYTITNNIFSMNFVPDEAGAMKDHSYELFFIDAVGHVLNDRQLIEIRDGKLSMERVQFCLNTRDDSGEQFELMIRESGQADYEVVARIPFRAKLAFAGTFSFDF